MNFTNPSSEVLAKRLVESFGEFPFTQEKSLDIIAATSIEEAVPESGAIFSPVYNNFVIEVARIYSETPDFDQELLWDVISDSSINLYDYNVALSNLLSSSQVSQNVKDEIVAATRELFTDEQQLELEEAFNRNTLSILETVEDAIKQSLFILQIYEKYFRYNIPAYRYNPMIRDLETAQVKVQSLKETFLP